MEKNTKIQVRSPNFHFTFFAFTQLFQTKLNFFSYLWDNIPYYGALYPEENLRVETVRNAVSTSMDTTSVSVVTIQLEYSRCPQLLKHGKYFMERAEEE